MSKEKWNESKTNNFIERYIKMEALWNVNDEDYSSKQKVALKNIIWRFVIKLIYVLERKMLRVVKQRVPAIHVRSQEQNSDIPDNLRTRAEKNGSQRWIPSKAVMV